MPFWVRRTQGTDFKINDIGQVVPATSDLDLAGVFDVQYLIRSTDLLAAFTAGDLIRLDGGLNPVPLVEALWGAGPPHSMVCSDEHKGGVSGDILFRGTARWECLSPGTPDQVLTAQGAANPEWKDASSVAGDSHYDLSTAESSTTSDLYQPKVRLTFTPPSAGYYELQFSAMVSASEFGVIIKTRIQLNDTTSYNEINQELGNFTYSDGAYYGRTGTIVVSLSAVSHNFDFDYCSGVSGKMVYIKEAYLTARRL